MPSTKHSKIFISIKKNNRCPVIPCTYHVLHQCLAAPPGHRQHLQKAFVFNRYPPSATATRFNFLLSASVTFEFSRMWILSLSTLPPLRESSNPHLCVQETFRAAEERHTALCDISFHQLCQIFKYPEYLAHIH